MRTKEVKMYCPYCQHHIDDDVIAKHLARKGGQKSRREITPDQQYRMQANRAINPNHMKLLDMLSDMPPKRMRRDHSSADCMHMWGAINLPGTQEEIERAVESARRSCDRGLKSSVLTRVQMDGAWVYYGKRYAKTVDLIGVPEEIDCGDMWG